MKDEVRKEVAKQLKRLAKDIEHPDENSPSAIRAEMHGRDEQYSAALRRNNEETAKLRSEIRELKTQLEQSRRECDGLEAELRGASERLALVEEPE